MIFEQENAEHLKPWLVRTLEPICDAEPGALADYVLALLKHNAPENELRKDMQVQLDEFLEKECSPFLDTLFTALRTKSYLPYTSSPSTSSRNPLDTGIPIPLDGLLSPSIPTSPDRSRKRTRDGDDGDGHIASKGPRLSAEGQFSRYNGRSADGRPTPGWNGARDRPQTNGYNNNVSGGMGMGMMNGPMGNGRRHGPQAYQPPDAKRGICRDYHNTGYCARGAYCKFSHGEDAIVPEQMFGQGMQNGGMPFSVPMFGNGYGMGGGPAATYDPREARMDMRPVGNGRSQIRPSVLPRMQQDDGSRVVHNIHASGELPVIQDLTPNIPTSDLQPNPNPRPQSQPPIPPPGMPVRPQPGFGGPSGQLNGDFPVRPQNFPGDVEMSSPMDYAASMRPPRGYNNRGGNRGGPGRGPGTFPIEAPNFRPERRKDKTLVMEKIPEDKLSLEHVNDWFKRFGTVTNVAIDKASSKALISFSTHEEAYSAWKSEDAVFNNRFVKLFWHRPMEGHGQTGTRLLAASAPVLANITAKETPQTSTPPPNPTLLPIPMAAIPRKTPTATAASLAAKQKLLEQQITEQKSLMASLDGASAEEKKTIMARLRKLGEEMSTDSSPVISQTSVPKTPVVPKAPVDREQREKERLDKELELHAQADADGDGESTEDLKAKLERLKAEAASLGISTGSDSTYHGSSYRPYRGRARGARSYYRGAARGGPPRTSMKLDNRPKKLLVKNVGTEHVQALQDWYETTGQVESLTPADNGDVIVAFKTRSAAEQGLAKGNSVPVIGSVQISWYTAPQRAPQSTKVAAPKALPAPSEDIVMQNPSRGHGRTPEPERPQTPQEEEIVATGWGGDTEDGMGML